MPNFRRKIYVKGAENMQARSLKQMSYRATIALLILILSFLVCIGSLVRVALVDGEKYKLKAEQSQLLDTMRGARAAGAKTQTSALRGMMKKDPRTRAEAMSLLFGGK